MKEKRVLLFGALAGAGLLGLLFYFWGYIETWHLWNIPASQLPFLDLRSVLSAAEAYAAGYDPTLTNPFDPGERKFNYPPVWYLILASGVTQDWTIPLGILLTALFVIGVVAFPGRLNGLSTFFLFLGLFSPATLLGIERGNVDLMFFFLMSMGLVLVENKPLLSLLTLIAGILFKIFPVFGIGYFLDGKDKKSLRLVAVGLLVAVLYFLVIHRSLITVFNNTPQSRDISYGVMVLPAYVEWLIEKKAVRVHYPFLYRLALRLNRVYSHWPLFPYVAALAAIVIFSYLGLLHRKESGCTELRNLRAFWLGAGIYIGTFLLGSNFDYRLMFLLFTLPQLAAWVREGTGLSRAVTWITVVALFLSMWYFVLQAFVGEYFPDGSYTHPIIDEGANWVLLGGIVYLYAFSLPPWIVDNVRGWLSRIHRSLRGLVPRRRWSHHG